MSTAPADDFGNLKRKGYCPCEESNCRVYGTLLTDSKGRPKHVDGCTCLRHRNANNRKSGTRAQVPTARAMGEQGVSRMRPGNEQTMRGVVRFEKKSGTGQHTVQTFYDRTRQQADKDLSIGDPRPYIGVSERDGRSLWVLAETDAQEIVYRLGMVYGFWSEA